MPQATGACHNKIAIRVASPRLPILSSVRRPTPPFKIIYKLGEFGLFLFSWGLQQLGPSKAALHVPLAPVAASVFGVVLLGEELSRLFLIGLTLAITGPILTNWIPNPSRVK